MTERHTNLVSFATTSSSTTPTQYSIPHPHVNKASSSSLWRSDSSQLPPARLRCLRWREILYDIVACYFYLVLLPWRIVLL